MVLIGIQHQTNMANWIVTSGTYSTTGGADINNEDVDLVIKPELANGEWSGAFIKKENFKIGGGTETSSGSCTWGDTGGSWNVDPDADPDSIIDSVEFFNSPDGVATNDSALNTQSNKVICRVTFQTSSAPNVDTVYNIDIDENPDTPITYAVNRQVCYRLKLPYNPQVAYTFLDNPSSSWGYINAISAQGVDGVDGTNVGVVGLTKTLTNASTYAEDGYYMWKVSGEIEPEDAQGTITTLKLAVRRADNHMPIDPLDPGTYTAPFTNPPDFDNYTFSFDHGGSAAGTAGSYQTNQQDIHLEAFPIQSVSYGLYPHQTLNFYREGSGNTAVDCFMAIIKVKFNPMEGDEDYANESNYPDPANYCDLGHQFNLVELDIVEPGEPPGLVISDVIAPTSFTRNAGHQVLTVRGTPGAEYQLNLRKALSLDTSAAALTKANFNFTLKNFQTNSSYNYFTIPANGFQEHTFRLPSVTSDTRYDIFVTPRNTTTIGPNAPSQAGDLSMTQTGTRTLTLYPSATTPGNFTDLTVAGLKTVLTRSEAVRDDIVHTTVITRCQTTISSSTSLVIEKRDTRIKPGMYVTIPKNGNGIPHGTTVSAVDGRVVTLSAASTITAKDTVRFDTNSSRILAFTKTYTGASNTPVFTTTATTAAGFDPDNTVGNLYSNFEVTAGGTSASTAITLRDINQIPDTGITNKFLRGAGISSSLGNYVQITSTTRGSKVINVAEAQDVSNGDVFEVIEDPTLNNITSANGEIYVIHVQGNHVHASPDTCTISGYLYIESIPADISLPINIDTLITTS